MIDNFLSSSSSSSSSSWSSSNSSSDSYVEYNDINWRKKIENTCNDR